MAAVVYHLLVVMFHSLVFGKSCKSIELQVCDLSKTRFTLSVRLAKLTFIRTQELSREREKNREKRKTVNTSLQEIQTTVTQCINDIARSLLQNTSVIKVKLAYPRTLTVARVLPLNQCVVHLITWLAPYTAYSVAEGKGLCTRESYGHGPGKGARRKMAFFLEILLFRTFLTLQKQYFLWRTWS